MTASKLRLAAYCWTILGMVFIPVPLKLFPYKVISFFVGSKADYIYSDSKDLYLLIGIIAVVGVVVAFFFYKSLTKYESWFRTITCYYLALMLGKYGFDKVTLAQFYTPEPNTLYTTLGQMPKELAFWSTMGLSPIYNYITGGIEIAVAALLLFSKTRLIGSILGVIVMAQVVLINISFDIDVKVFSLFLLCCFLLLTAPFFKTIWAFFLGRPVQLITEPVLPIDKSLRLGLKTLIILLIVIEMAFGQIAGLRPFDDRFGARPALYGAYEVVGHEAVRRVFVHRQGFLILENQAGEMTDYAMTTDTIAHTIILTDYDLKLSKLKYALVSDTLHLLGAINAQQVDIRAVKLNVKKLPALK
jgi:hypothetical protein